MPGQCATITLTRSSTVAAGLYAPGHLGELTQYVPFELVDAVLEETGRVQRRLRSLPSRVGVYYLLALTLFPDHSYRGVWDQLTAALGPLDLPRVSTTALRHLRRRITAAPLKLLFDTLAGPLAPPAAPGVRYRRFRTVAFDGCSSIKTPDSERARGRLGKVRHRLAWAGYPTVLLMTLVETGTRGLLGACFGPTSGGETGYAARLLHLLGAEHLLLVDRGFDSNDFLAKVAATGAQFLARCKSTRRPPLLRALPDGSYLSRFGNLTVRIIEADVTCVPADGTRVGGRYRLATTLLDPDADPAETLIRLYTERWEIESAYFALRHTLMAAGSCARATGSASSRNCGPPWPSTRRCAPPWSTPCRPVRAPTPTARPSPWPCGPPARRRPSPPASPLTGPRRPPRSAPRSWPTCCRPAAPASAPARSSPRSRATTPSRARPAPPPAHP